MAFGHVHVAIAWVRDDIRGVRQGFGRISSHAGFPKGHEDLAVRAELDDHASFVLFAGKLFEIICGWGSRVGHPQISISIDMDTMWPDEHPAAKAPDLLARLIEMVDRV